jgi:5-methyltetrahydrofolate--homocysteine methyltransferase
MKGDLLLKQMAERILILDGALGTMFQDQKLSAKDFGGPEFEGCNEVLNLERPEIVSSIHEAYLEAGADIIETNSFGATEIVLAEYGLKDYVWEINKKAASLARKAADRWSSSQKPRFVAGSMGPTTKMLSLTRGISFSDFEDAYYHQALGLLEGGVDLLLLETCQDTLNVKAAGLGIKRAFSKLKKFVPLMISATIEPSRTMLAGQNIEAFYVSIRHLNPLAVGLNCGTGAELMKDSLSTLAGLADCAVCCYPNAGFPDEEGNYQETPAEFAAKMSNFAARGWLNIAGGCCGTRPEHIKALASALAGLKPRKKSRPLTSALSGLETIWPEEENRPLLVGERCNIIGSRRFKELIMEENWEEGAEIARAQVKKGAQIVDICVANPDREEVADMKSFLPRVLNRVKVPLMLDSTDPEVLEAGLRLTQGKSIINSINLENGRRRFEEVVPLAKKYGAALVVGVIDEEGMALTRERKLAVAKRSYEILVQEYGICPGDIIFDPLTFPVGTGDSKYLGSAVETIEGLRLIKQNFPQCKTILGISNVSFGLPAAGREVLNSVFLYLNTLAGLDYAIVNTEKLRRYPTIPSEEIKLAEDLLLNTGEETVKAFTEFYRGKKVEEVKRETITLPLEERLAQNIVAGSRENLEANLLEALKKYKALEIINGPLMKGMEEVGVLFNENKLIVAEVLQSAEVMQAAVKILEPFMEKAEDAKKGKVILATVKGDVHDIGKNLVEIILRNNGYEVINLGVKVSSEQLIEACKKEKPDAIGLSGLLVKSVQQMLLTAQDLREAGIQIPLLLGGAALSERFTKEKIAPAYKSPVFYARDAMDSLPLLRSLPKNNRGEGKTSSASLTGQGQKVDLEPVPTTSKDSSGQPLLNYPLSKLFPYLDKQKIVKRYLGFKKTGAGSKDRKFNFAAKAPEFVEYLENFLKEVEENRLIQANGIYAFFPAFSADHCIHLLGSNKKVLEKLTFPRSQIVKTLSIPDLVSREPGNPSDIALFAVTTGSGVREKAETLMEKGEYLKSYLLQALALELAEAFAEHLHETIRGLWGIPHEKGIRVSPGYPVFPDLENQRTIFRLLQPERMGLFLTDGEMMDPEASVTALVIP